MTAPQIKVKIQRSPTLKLKMLPKFPASVTGTGGIDVTNVGGNYVISPELGVLGDVTGPGSTASVAGELAIFTDPNNIEGSGILASDLAINNHEVAVGTGGTGFRGSAPGAFGQVLTSLGASADPSFQPTGQYNVAAYVEAGQTIHDAIADAVAAGGGTIIVPESYSLGSTGIDLDSVVVPIRITGPDGVNGGTGQSVMLTYTGTGSMISAIGNYGLEIDHIYLYPSGAGAKIINAKDSFALSVHDCMLVHSTTSASNLGIDLDTAQIPVIRRNGIGTNGGTGVRGVVTSFSVKAIIAENTFFSSNNVCIEAPGQDWHIVDNVAQDPTTNFIKKGPATTCDVLHVSGNDIDDGTGAKTWITSNAGVLISEGNRFTNSGTCISQDNSTGAVVSIGDRLDASVAGIAIGTGNYLTIEVPEQGHLPTTLYSGTPANANVVKTIGGLVDITGKLSLGLSGSYAGSLRFWNTTAGANSVTMVPAAGAIGLVTATLPSVSDTIVVRSASEDLTNKTYNKVTITAPATSATLTLVDGTTLTGPAASGTAMTLGNAETVTGAKTFGSAGAVGKLKIAGTTSGSTILDATAAASGTLTLPAATDTLVGKATTDELTNKTLTASVGKGTWTASGTWTLPAFTLGGTVSGGGNQINNVVIGTATPLGGTFTTLAATSSLDLTNSQDANTAVTMANSNGGTSAMAFFQASNGTNVIRLGMRGTAQSAYGALAANTAFFYGATDFTFMSDGGKLVFASGGNAEKMRLTTTGGLALGSTTDPGAGSYIGTGGALLYSGTAVPAGGTTGSGLKFSSTSNLGVFFGSGAPSLSAAQGSLYIRTDGSSTSTRMYINTNGSTTWTAVTTAA